MCLLFFVPLSIQKSKDDDEWAQREQLSLFL